MKPASTSSVPRGFRGTSCASASVWSVGESTLISSRMLSAAAGSGLSIAWSGPWAGPLDRRQHRADTRQMEDLSERELDELLETLEADERDISTTRRRLHDRIATFPPETAA